MLAGCEKRIYMDADDPENMQVIDIISELYGVVKGGIAPTEREHDKGT